MAGIRSRSASSSAEIHWRTWGSGSAPLNASTGWPPTTATTIGMDWTPNAWAIRGLASTSTLARTQAPLPASASRSSTGESCLQGPHQVAQRSTTTGTCNDRSRTSAWKLCSVTSMTKGLPSALSAPPDACVCVCCERTAASERAFRADRSTAPAMADDSAAVLAA